MWHPRGRPHRVARRGVGRGLEALPAEPGSHGLIHDDLHGGNLVVTGDGFTVIDFECCHHTWLVADIASALLFATWKVPGEDAAEANARARWVLANLLKGYLRERHIAREWLQRMPLFLKLREMSLYVSWHARRDTQEAGDAPGFAYWLRNVEEGVPYVELDFGAL